MRNTIVIKSSEKAPLSVLLVAKAAQESGLPKGVSNLGSGFGLLAGDALTRHMDVRRVVFPGSAAVVGAIKKVAVGSNLKYVTLDLGGESHLIVFLDADLKKEQGAVCCCSLHPCAFWLSLHRIQPSLGT